MKYKEKVERFNKLVPKAAELHPLTWCVKRQATIPTIWLKGEICCACDEFVLNRGVCDPI